MKKISAFPAAIALCLTACESMNRPITSGDFDPLRPPGSTSNRSNMVASAFTAGQFVRCAMDNTAFFKKRPSGEADADKLLARGTFMKVISNSDSYAKVELDSGEVGYVPSVMLEDPAAAISVPALNPNEFQAYPSTGGAELPLPSVAPGEKPPEGAIPTVIDPDAPPHVVSPSGPAPLPPNGKEN